MMRHSSYLNVGHHFKYVLMQKHHSEPMDIFFKIYLVYTHRQCSLNFITHQGE